MTALEANLKVTELTPEEVAALGDEAKRLYPSVSLLGTKVIGAMETLNGLVIGNNSISTHWNSYDGISDYIFVNKRNAEVRLNRELSAQTFYRKKENNVFTLKDGSYDAKNTPGYFMTNALSAAQIKDLEAYCTEKGMTLKDFLLNTVGFTATVNSENCFLLSGQQSVKYQGYDFMHMVPPEWYICNAVNMNKTSSKEEKITVWANTQAMKSKGVKVFSDITFVGFRSEADYACNDGLFVPAKAN